MPLNFRKIKAFYSLLDFFLAIFAAIAFKFVYCFVVESYSSTLRFGVIDLLFNTNIDGRIVPCWRCSCF